MALSLGVLGLEIEGDSRQVRGQLKALRSSVEGSLGPIGQLSKGASFSLEELGGFFGGLSGKANIAAGAIGVASAAFIGVGVAAAGALKAIDALTGGFQQFQLSIAEVSTLVDSSTVSNEMLADSVRDLATQFGGDLNAQASALYQTISAGAAAGAEATTVLTEANKLAVGGVTDVETAVDGLTSVLNAYNLDASEASRVTDSFFVAVRDGKTTIGELSSGIGTVASLAANSGVSLENLNAVLTEITKRGVRTDAAFTQIRGALTNILKPSQEATQFAEKLGIEFGAAALESKDFVQFLIDTSNAVGGSTEALAVLFPNVRGLGAILNAVSGEGDNLVKALENQADKTGAADTAFQKINVTINAQKKRLSALGQTVSGFVQDGIVSFTGYSGILEDLEEVLTDIKNAFMFLRETSLDAGAAASETGGFFRFLFDTVAAGISVGSRAVEVYQILSAVLEGSIDIAKRLATVIAGSLSVAYRALTLDISGLTDDLNKVSEAASDIGTIFTNTANRTLQISDRFKEFRAQLRGTTNDIENFGKSPLLDPDAEAPNVSPLLSDAEVQAAAAEKRLEGARKRAAELAASLKEGSEETKKIKIEQGNLSGFLDQGFLSEGIELGIMPDFQGNAGTALSQVLSGNGLQLKTQEVPVKPLVNLADTLQLGSFFSDTVAGQFGERLNDILATELQRDLELTARIPNIEIGDALSEAKQLTEELLSADLTVDTANTERDLANLVALTDRITQMRQLGIEADPAAVMALDDAISEVTDKVRTVNIEAQVDAQRRGETASSLFDVDSLQSANDNLQRVSDDLAQSNVGQTINDSLRGIAGSLGQTGQTFNAALSGFAAGGPIGAAVGAGVQLLTSTEAFAEIAQDLEGIFNEAVDAIEPLVEAIGNGLQPIIEPLKDVFEALGDVFEEIAPAIETVVSTIAGAIAPVLDVLGRALSSLAPTLGSLAEIAVAINVPLKQFELSMSLIAAQLEVLFAILEPFIKAIEAITEVIAGATGFLNTAVSGVAGAITGAGTAVGGAISSAGAAAADFIGLGGLFGGSQSPRDRLQESIDEANEFIDEILETSDTFREAAARLQGASIGAAISSRTLANEYKQALARIRDEVLAELADTSGIIGSSELTFGEEIQALVQRVNDVAQQGGNSLQVASDAFSNLAQEVINSPLSDAQKLFRLDKIQEQADSLNLDGAALIREQVQALISNVQNSFLSDAEKALALSGIQEEADRLNVSLDGIDLSLEGAANAQSEAANNLNKAASSLSNVPDGFKVALTRFEATQAINPNRINQTPTSGPGFADSVNSAFNQTRAALSQTRIDNVTVIAQDDPIKTWEEIQRVALFEKYRLFGSSRVAENPLVGS